MISVSIGEWGACCSLARPTGAPASAWRTWWLGDMMGVLVVAMGRAVV